MKSFTDLVQDSLQEIEELFPWDLSEKMEDAYHSMLLLDIREPAEFDAAHIEGSISVPRGILESACDWGYDDTIPALVEARDKEVIVICRSGNRSALAALTMKQMGYKNPISLKTGLRGWNDFEQALVDINGKQVDVDDADELFVSKVSSQQMGPET
ncbi:MAG: rhodanese-like domain-containing protein [Gammaproteobacteria bacterium]|nr:rhodanese-like domain-containing protein [Gammaproteobacteria bacterium]